MGKGMRPDDKAKNFSGTIRKLVSYMKPYYVQIILILLFAVSSTVCTIIAPKILGNKLHNRRINVPGTGSHHQSFKRCQSHGSIHTLTIQNSTDRRSVSKMGNNNLGILQIQL